MICTICRRLMLLMYPRSHIHVVAAERLIFCSAVRGRLDSPRAPPGWRPAAAPSRRIQRPASEHHPPTRTCMASNHDSDQKALWQGRPSTIGILTRYNCTGLL